MNIAGTWKFESVVAMGSKGRMRIHSTWVFTADHRAELRTATWLECEGETAGQTRKTYRGTWRADGGVLVVDVDKHYDSPFRLTLSGEDQLCSSKGGVWMRS